MGTVTLCFSSLNADELTSVLYALSHVQRDNPQPASLARTHEAEHNGGRAGAAVHKMGAGYQVTSYALTAQSAAAVLATVADSIPFPGQSSFLAGPTS